MVESGSDGVMNWQNARYKAEILAHPLYDQLLSAHVACLRIATPVDQLPRIDAQLGQSQNVVAKYSALGHGAQGMVGDDKELEQFLVCLLLSSFFSLLLSFCCSQFVDQCCGLYVNGSLLPLCVFVIVTSKCFFDNIFLFFF